MDLVIMLLIIGALPLATPTTTPLNTPTPFPETTTPLNTTTPFPETTTPLNTTTAFPETTTPLNTTTPFPETTTPLNTTAPFPETTTPLNTTTPFPETTTPLNTTTPFPETTTPLNTTTPFPETTTPLNTTTAFPETTTPLNTTTPFPETTTPLNTTTPFPETTTPLNTTTPFPETTAPLNTTTAFPETTTPLNTTTPFPETTTPLNTTAPFPETTTPLNTTTAFPETTTPLNTTTPFPETTTPLNTTTPFPETTTPLNTTTAFPETTTPLNTTTAFPETTTPLNTTTPFPETTTPLNTTTPFPETTTPLNTATPFPETTTPLNTTTPFPETTTPLNTTTAFPETTTPLNTTTAFPETTTPLNTTTPFPETTTPLNTTTPFPETTTPLNTTTPFPETTTPLNTATPFPETTTPLNTTTPFPETTTPLNTTTPFPETTTPLNTTTPFPETTTPLNTTTPFPETTTPLNTTTPFPETTTPLNTTTPFPETTTPSETTTPFPESMTPSVTTTPSETTTPSVTTPPPNTTPPFPTTPPPPPATTTTATAFPSTTTSHSSTSTMSTALPTTPVLCLNGGELLDGICICSDDWTGPTCSEANFCHRVQINGLTFPQTPVGWFSYSDEMCPAGSSGVGKPKASTRCSTNNGRPSFEQPLQILQCDQTLSDIQQNLTSPADLETLASSTQILTSRPEDLTAENITTAAQIANTLLSSPNATQNVRVSAVATVSQLLNASVPDDPEENSATLGLTLTLDQLSLSLSLGQNSSQSQVVQPNLVVQSAQISSADARGVQFTSLTGTSGSFVADRIQLDTNASRVTVENGFIADALIYVQFPTDAASVRQTSSNVSLGFVLYQNDRFFRSSVYRGRRAAIRVLSASVKGQDRALTPQHVEMLFRPALISGTKLHAFACVFWNYSLNDWSTAGCSKGNASDGVLQCVCNHTTNFAALWSFSETYEYAEALSWISIIGLSVSILGLIVTIVHHITENFQKKFGTFKNSKITLLCICFSLLTFIIIFLSGVNNYNSDPPVEISQANVIPPSDEYVEPDRHSWCTAVAALLHYFLLATFAWNAMHGTQLVVLIRTNSRNLPQRWTPISLAVGWGAPAVVMAITLGSTYRRDNPLEYRQEEFCWLSGLDSDKRFDFGKPLFWGFVVPVGLVLIYNIVLLVLVSMTTCKTDPKLSSTRRSSAWKKFLTSFSLAVLLGVSWTLGFLVLISSKETNLLFSILFCVFTTTQGLQIFIFFTARTPTFRAVVFRSFQFLSSVSTPLLYTKYSLWRTRNRDTSTDSYKDLKEKLSMSDLSASSR